MLLGAVTFVIATVLVKFLGDVYSPAAQTFWRQLTGVVMILPAVLRSPSQVLHFKKGHILLFRAACGTVGTMLAFYAYQRMPLADANALSFTRILWIVPLAVFLLGEKVSTFRVGATLVGFLGVLLMVQPGGANFGLPAAASLAAALLFALAITGLKTLTGIHSPTSLLAWTTLIGMLISIPFAIAAWRTPTFVELAYLVGIGVFATLTQFCVFKGMWSGDATVMAPIDYTRLIFALAADYFIFKLQPNLMTLAGAGIVIAATLSLTLLDRRPPPPTAADN